ncbi:MAG TPA: hypothetical protein VGN54_03875 [Mycobacteriales bacterium]|nr:hypothetical protein [Mycobacteriales bacterium]
MVYGTGRARSVRGGGTSTGASGGRPKRPAARQVSGRQQRHARRLNPQQLAERAERRAAAAATRPVTTPSTAGARLTFTTRAAVLALAFCAVVLTLAYPVKAYLAQRAEINSQRTEQRTTLTRLTQLTRAHAQAQDPAQVQIQARIRLHYVFPGQQNYLELAPPAVPAAPVAEAGHAKVPLNPHATWYGRLWTSDVAAGKK